LIEEVSLLLSTSAAPIERFEVCCGLKSCPSTLNHYLANSIDYPHTAVECSPTSIAPFLYVLELIVSRCKIWHILWNTSVATDFPVNFVCPLKCIMDELIYIDLCWGRPNKLRLVVVHSPPRVVLFYRVYLFVLASDVPPIFSLHTMNGDMEHYQGLCNVPGFSTTLSSHAG
jgi:hypothetical protein